jgi:hypothetical protein
MFGEQGETHQNAGQAPASIVVGVTDVGFVLTVIPLLADDQSSADTFP